MTVCKNVTQYTEKLDMRRNSNLTNFRKKSLGDDYI